MTVGHWRWPWGWHLLFLFVRPLGRAQVVVPTLARQAPDAALAVLVILSFVEMALVVLSFLEMALVIL